jgi:hypothetical protein
MHIRGKLRNRLLLAGDFEGLPAIVRGVNAERCFHTTFLKGVIQSGTIGKDGDLAMILKMREKEREESMKKTNAKRDYTFGKMM